MGGQILKEGCSIIIIALEWTETRDVNDVVIKMMLLSFWTVLEQECGIIWKLYRCPEMDKRRI